VGFLKTTYPIKRSIIHAERRVVVMQNWRLFLDLGESCLTMSVFDVIADCVRRVYPYTLDIRLGKSLACMFGSGEDCGRLNTHKIRSDLRREHEGGNYRQYTPTIQWRIKISALFRFQPAQAFFSSKPHKSHNNSHTSTSNSIHSIKMTQYCYGRICALGYI
jgi:hypothetical protein